MIEGENKKITKKMKESFPNLNVSTFKEFEDTISDKPLFACTGNSCEI
jgi:hypothetical protein